MFNVTEREGKDSACDGLLKAISDAHGEAVMWTEQSSLESQSVHLYMDLRSVLVEEKRAGDAEWQTCLDGRFPE